MKRTLTTLLLALVALPAVWAQSTVNASDILAKINRKEAISYQNATITGDLDLTSLANRKEIRNKDWGNQEHYLSVVDVPMTFKNCTFKGKVLAYRSEDQDKKPFMGNNIVYNTDFSEAVTIENCRFEEEAAFKYSNFSQQAIFSGNTFQDGALFKYAKFQNAADFSGSTFRGYADFKYTKFNEASFFRQSVFERPADFKYTKFDERVDFGQARFTSNADFKYTHLPRGTTFDNTRFDGSTDFKYTTLDGRKFSPTSR